jgi:MoaA/NifB/PqqE/SkfB family radical SAM enzyme
MRWLELALDYRCNLRCLGCHACNDTGETMSTAVALARLRSAREAGCARLWLGGGEPTLREDLLVLIRAARAAGYVEVLLQTNGMRLSYPAYREAIVAAGVTEVRVNVKSHRAILHDRLSRGESHAHLLTALDGLVGTAVVVSADVLLTRSGLPDLADTISFYAGKGVTRFVLWLLSAADSSEAEVLAEVPTFSEIAPHLALAAERATATGVAIESLHTPPCTLPSELRHLFSPAATLSLTVTTPEGRTFPLAESSFEGGAFLDGCERCAARQGCGGPRSDYIRLHGVAEFVPLVH